MFLSAVISALSTEALLGYFLVVPEWFCDLLIIFLVYVVAHFVFRLFIWWS